MEKMAKIEMFYFINLNRREDRKIHFLNQCIKENLPMNKVCRIEAIDGLIHNFHNNELKMFSNANFYRLNPEVINKKIMGNQLSHYYLWKEIIRENQKVTIIFQDDAVLIPNFMEYIDNVSDNLPSDTEIINIGLHKVAVNQYSEQWDFTTNGNDFHKIGSQIINEYVCKLKPEINPFSLAYIVTLEGAKNMVKHFDENGCKEATDHNINKYLISKDIFYSSNTILATGNPRLGSDIFTF
jgi:GR25 family glycosyltransferase involved in LPS biosynthesis